MKKGMWSSMFKLVLRDLMIQMKMFFGYVICLIFLTSIFIIGIKSDSITSEEIYLQFDISYLFIIMIFNEDYKTTLIAGIVIGIFTALTTKTPGGQIPNILDKLITCNVMYLILVPLRNRICKTKQITLLLSLGTLVSGTTFLVALATFAGLPGGASFKVLFMTIVVPTIVLNLIIGLVIYKISEKTLQITGTFS